MIPVALLVAGGLAVAGGAVVVVRKIRNREPAVEIATVGAKVMPPARAQPPPPARMPKPDDEDFGANVCSFGIASHCYWQPVAVKPLGLHRFEWGFCMARWKDDLAKGEKGGIRALDTIVNGILAIASALTLGLSQEAIERLCFRFQWQLRSYEIDGEKYWGIRYIAPERHILTGEIVKPPPNPVKDGAWVHINKPGDYASGAMWSVPVYSVFFSDGNYRDMVKQAELRTLLREYEMNPETLTVFAREASDEKSRVVLSTKAKADAVYR